MNILYNYDDMYDMYISKKMSTTEIAKRLGCSSPTVLHWLKVHNIPRRDRSEGLRIKNPPILLNQNLIDGGLLGDAYLQKLKKGKFPYYTRSNIFYEHVLHNAQGFYPDIEYAKSRIKTYNYGHYKPIHKFTTFCYKELMPTYDRWYPAHNNYKKYVPQDIDFTPELLRHWFYDDGTTSFNVYKARGKTIKYPTCHLCTQGFSKIENQYLCDSINNRYSEMVRIVKDGKHFQLRFIASKIEPFLELIGKPIGCFEYKWKSKQVILH